MRKLNYEQIKTALLNRLEFEGNSMRAVAGRTWETGQLPDEQAKTYNEAAQAGKIHYTVISYHTPIAWITSDGSKIVPDVRYSVTTSRQQSLCRTYLWSANR